MSGREKIRGEDVHLLPRRRRRPLEAGAGRHAPAGRGRSNATAAGRCTTAVHQEAGGVARLETLADFGLALVTR